MRVVRNVQVFTPTHPRLLSTNTYVAPPTSLSHRCNNAHPHLVLHHPPPLPPQNVGLSVHACRALADLLPNPEGLKKLHLANNMSDDEGAKSIGQLLAKAPNMQDFKMWYCRVKGPGGSGEG